MKKLYALLLLAVFVVSCFAFQPVKAATYTYTLVGPYYDNNTVADACVNVTIKFYGASPQSFNMQNSGASPNTTIITSSYPAQSLSWNASSALNYTGVYDFMDGASDSVNIYVANPANVVNLYYFTISDIGANMVDPYFQVSTAPTGTTTYPMERRSLNGTATVAFFLTQFSTYTLTFICDAGSYSQSFLADTTTAINLPVLYGAFPSSNTSAITIEAQRLNNSAIQVVYVDPTSTTDWLALEIAHQSGSSTIIDYISNTTGYSQTILWNYAITNFNYIVYANFSLAGSLQSYQMTVPKAQDANPWDNQLDWLGPTTETYPDALMGWPNGMSSLQIGQLVAVFFIMLFLSIGSFRNAGATMVIAWVAGGLMFAMGWYTGGAAQAGASGIPLFCFALFLGIITHMQEKKSEGSGLS